MSSHSWLLLPLILAACGPGASDHPPLPASDATFDLPTGLTLADPSAITGSAAGAWACAPCLQPGAVPGLPPPAFAIAGTYGPNGDADTGSASWSGDIDITGDAIAIPFAAGPDASRIKLAVSIDGRRHIARPGRYDQWRFWRIRTTPGRHHVEIRISDMGSQPGQWIAAGPPQILR